MSGFRNNVYLLGCIGVMTSGDCQNLVMINCSGISGNSAMNNRTYNLNGRLLKNGWTELNATTAAAISPYALNGNAGNKYKVKADTGDRYAVLDVVALDGESVNFKITDNTYSLILSTQTNTETIDGNALPFTISPSLYDNYVISSDGSNFWIL